MKITIGTFIIEHDGCCVTLSKEKIMGDNSKNPGETYESTIGYFPNMLRALDRLLEERMGEADSLTVEELRSVIIQAKHEISTKFAELKQAVINSKKAKP